MEIDIVEEHSPKYPKRYGWWNWNENICTRPKCFKLGPVDPSDSQRGKIDETVFADEQYHIPPTEERNSIFYCFKLRLSFEESLKRTTSWMYRKGYGKVIVVLCIVYFVLVTIYAALIYLITWGYTKSRNRSCVSGWILDGSVSDNFEISYQLSWTTFSTVGYGNPAPSSERNCFGVRFICALEAFMGMLYVSCAGAILYAKIVHLNTIADVTFSSTMVIQYGPGLRDRSTSNEEKDSSPDTLQLDYEEKQIISLEDADSFPVMEFRIINNQANRTGSEIVEASLTCSVVIVHDIFSSKETTDLVDVHRADISWKRVMKEHVIHLGHRVREKQRSFGQSLQPAVREKTAMFKSFIYELEVEPSQNPLFSQVWYVRHTLNENSPLLKPDVRARIRSNQGRWPQELDDPSLLRNALMEFRQIVVTLNGTSMETLDNVLYAKSYIFKDLCIGWRFSGLYYNNTVSHPGTTGIEMKVDYSLIHDILPQLGGGHEPLKGKNEKRRII